MNPTIFYHLKSAVPLAQVAWATKRCNLRAELRFDFYDNVLVCDGKVTMLGEGGCVHKLFLLRLLICMRLTCVCGL